MKKKKLIIFGVFLLLLVVGTTFAFFQTNFLGIKNVSVVTPQIELTYKEKTNAISVSDAKSDEVGKTISYFEFDVEAFSSIPYDIFYLIYLTEQNSTLSSEYVKVYLTKVENNIETEVVAPTYINKLKEYALAENSRSLYRKASFNLPGDETITHTYRLRAWITDEKPVKVEANKVTNGDTTNVVIDSLTYNFTVNVATKEAALEGNLSKSWQNITPDEYGLRAIYTLDTRELPETYNYNDTTYTLQRGIDVSEQQNGSVIFGTYSDGTNKIGVFGQDEGVVAPSDCTNLFIRLDYVTIMDLGKFNTSNVTNMISMFRECSSLTSLDLSNFNTSNVTNMSSMFSGCRSLTSLDLSNFDTSNVTNMSSMFSESRKITTINLNNFDTSNVTNMSSMFSDCRSLTSLDLSNFDTSNTEDMSRMFYHNDNLESLDLSSYDTSKVTDMSVMFNNCSSLTSLDLSNFDTSNVTNMSSMFSESRKITTINLNNFDTSNVTNMSYMFHNCYALISLDLSNFDTSNVINMSSMFYNCISLTSLDLSNFNTSNVTNMSSMFSGCKAVTEAYARSMADSTKLNASSNKPTTWNFVSVASIVEVTIDNQSSTLVTVAIPEGDVIEGGVSIYTIVPIDENSVIVSFKLNGKTIEGNTFVAPLESGTVTISDVIIN